MAIRKEQRYEDGTFATTYSQVYRNKCVETFDFRCGHYAIVLDFLRGIRTEERFKEKLDSAIKREVIAYKIENYDSTVFEPGSYPVVLSPIKDRILLEKILRQKLVEDGIFESKKTQEEPDSIEQGSFYFQRELDGSRGEESRGRTVEFSQFFQCNSGDDKED